LRLILCDLYRSVVQAMEAAFADRPEVECRQGDLTDLPADAYVSPANSYGDMSGGVDFNLRERFGWQVEDRVQGAIRQRGGPLPLGEALVVETEDEEVLYLVVAPTMLLPADISQTDNAYLAMRAVLRAVDDWNETHPGEIETVAMTALGTGVGRMPAERAAAQMRRAYDDWRAASAR
jgi:O-acetyl-ADP-ribose deacetylase (regulator of RNase III)